MSLLFRAIDGITRKKRLQTEAQMKALLGSLPVPDPPNVPYLLVWDVAAQSWITITGINIVQDEFGNKYIEMFPHDPATGAGFAPIYMGMSKAQGQEIKNLSVGTVNIHNFLRTPALVVIGQEMEGAAGHEGVVRIFEQDDSYNLLPLVTFHIDGSVQLHKMAGSGVRPLEVDNDGFVIPGIATTDKTQYAVKPASTTRTIGQNTLILDNDFTLPIVAGKLYEFDMTLFLNMAAGQPAERIKVQIAVPGSGQTGKLTGYASGLGLTQDKYIFDPITGLFQYRVLMFQEFHLDAVRDRTSNSYNLKGIFMAGDADGDITLSWGIVNNVTNVTMENFSFIKLTEIS